MRWTDVAADPRSPAALAPRARMIADAWVTDTRDRRDVLAELAAGRVVLDLGCADHPPEARHHPSWLHDRVATTAARCVGVDSNAEAVADMRAGGYEIVEGTLDDVDALAGMLGTDFDLVVAGELIEHLSAPGALFDLARRVLAPGGRLVLSTPNAYAPWRQRAGQLQVIWENADHIAHFFPAGLVELGERYGFRLSRLSTHAEAVTSDLLSLRVSVARGVRHSAARVRRRLQPARGEYVTAALYASPAEVALIMLRRAQKYSQETLLCEFELPP